MTDPLADLREAYAREDMLGVSIEARRLIDANPLLGGLWAEVAKLTYDVGDELVAYAASRKFTEAEPNNLQAWLWLSSMMSTLGRYEDALEVLEAQIARYPGDGGLQRRVGRAYLALGRTRMAELSFRRALALNVSDARAWEDLSEAITFEKGGDDLARLEEVRIQAGDQITGPERGMLSYALAKAYTDIGELDVAAMRVTEGAAFYRESAPFDVGQHEMAIEAIIDSFNPAFVEAREDAGVLDARPVLMVAMPNAGVEWLSTALAADPGAGQLMPSNALLWMNAAMLGNQTASEIVSAVEGDWNRNVLGEMAKRYLAQCEEALGGPVQRIIDPTTVAEMSAGAFGLSLPAAKIIRVLRDPRDLAWSIYKTRFRRARNWTYHPDDIARIIACHLKLTQHWAKLFEGRVMTVTYEALCESPQDTVRQVAKFVGLDQDAAAAEAWLTADQLKADPVGVHQQAGSRFAPIEAALERAGII